MTAILQAPEDLAKHDFFVTLYDNETGDYVIALPDGQTFEIGDAETTFRYMIRALGNEELAGRAMDVAMNFGASSTVPKKNRVTAEDTYEKISEAELFFGKSETSEPVLVLPNK